MTDSGAFWFLLLLHSILLWVGCLDWWSSGREKQQWRSGSQEVWATHKKKVRKDFAKVPLLPEVWCWELLRTLGRCCLGLPLRSRRRKPLQEPKINSCGGNWETNGTSQWGWQQLWCCWALGIATIVWVCSEKAFPVGWLLCSVKQGRGCWRHPRKLLAITLGSPLDTVHTACQNLNSLESRMYYDNYCLSFVYSVNDGP